MLNLFEPYRGLPREIYILFLARTINSIGAFVFPLLSLILTGKIGMSKTDAGIFMTTLAVLQVPSLILGGKIGDTFGRKKVIFISNILGASCYIISGMIKPSMLTAYMIVIASSFYTLSGPSFEAVTADLTTPDNRKSSYSLLYMGFNLGFSVGPLIGGLLYKDFLSLVFIGDAITTLISIVLFMIYVPETHSKEHKVEIDDSRVLEKHQEGSVFKVLLQRPILIYFALIMFVYQFAYSQWGFALPLHMKDIFGDPGAAYYGVAASFNGVVVIVFTPIILKLTRKAIPMKIVAIGGFFYAIAFGSFGFAKVLLPFLIGIFVMTLGEIMISINNNTFVANHTPASHRSRVSSIIQFITGAGYSLGPLIMGRVLSSYGPLVSWSIISVSVAIGAVLICVLSRWEQRTSESGRNLSL
jgi:MFS family permease